MDTSAESLLICSCVYRRIIIWSVSYICSYTMMKELGLLLNIYRLQTLCGKWKFCSSKAMFLFHGGQFVCPLHLEVKAHKLARVALCCWWRCGCQCTCFLHSLVFSRSNTAGLTEFWKVLFMMFGSDGASFVFCYGNKWYAVGDGNC